MVNQSHQKEGINLKPTLTLISLQDKELTANQIDTVVFFVLSPLQRTTEILQICRQIFIWLSSWPAIPPAYTSK
jgi:hypothetical protein